MRFITEEDLRSLYKKEPFTAYVLEPDAKLTPGARQFLADRRISLVDDHFANKQKAAGTKVSTETSAPKHDWKNLRLYSKLRSCEALFLLTIEELLKRDVDLTQSVIKLKEQFAQIKKAVKNKGTVGNLCCTECTGINEQNFSANLDACFEITEFHLQLEKGKEILLLHRLRCALQEIEPVVLEICFNSNEENGLYLDIIAKVNQIINSLSQLICLALGGKKCQRES
jgi:ethanolamine utilization cobalamin adenosyltransferase